MPVDAQTYAIIGAAMKVHRLLGPGHLERPYHEALALELERQGIPTRCEVPFAIHYDGVLLQAKYRADLVCFDRVLVELKANPWIGRTERAQVENYLRCSGLPIALLLNFARTSLEYWRLSNPANRPKSGESVS